MSDPWRPLREEQQQRASKRSPWNAAPDIAQQRLNTGNQSTSEREADVKQYGYDPYEGVPTQAELTAGYEAGGGGRYSQGNIRQFTLERQRRKKEADLKLMAQQELEAARNFNPYQTVRYTEGMKLGGRTIQEGATARTRSTESGLARLGLSESPLAEAYRRADREYTAMQQQGLSGELILKELDTHFQNEQAAIARMFSVGQEEAAFARQANLLEQQFRYNLMLEQERTKGAFLAGLGEAVGAIPGMVLMGFGGGNEE